MRSPEAVMAALDEVKPRPDVASAVRSRLASWLCGRPVVATAGAVLAPSALLAGETLRTLSERATVVAKDNVSETSRLRLIRLISHACEVLGKRCLNHQSP
jgi:hypothetical protein